MNDEYKTKQRLDILRKIDQAILSTHSSAEIAQETLVHFRQLVNCQRASILLFDFDAGETITLAAQVSGKTKFRAGLHLPLAKFGGDLDLLRQGKVDLVKDIRTLASPTSNITTLQDEGMGSFLAVPLITQNELIGTLIIGANSPDAFGVEDIDIAREVADSLAVSLQQAQLWESLQKSEARYRAIVEDQSDLICRFLPDGTLTFVNETYGRYFNTTYERLIGHSFFSFIPAEEREQAKQQIALLDQKNLHSIHDYQILTANNDVRWLQWNIRAIPDKQNQVVEFQAIGQDITERKETEKALRENEEKFRSIFQFAPLAIAQQNMGGLPTDLAKMEHRGAYNDMFLKMLGYTIEELHTLGLAGIAHPEDTEKDRLLVQELLEGKRHVYQIEKRFYHKDGTLVWGHLTVTLIRDAEGKPQTLIGMVSDITERKRTEEALLESEQRFRTIFEFAPLSIIYSVIIPTPFEFTDAESRMEFNDQFAKMLGYKREELLALGITGVSHPEDMENDLALLKELFAGERQVYRIEKRYIKKDGSLVWGDLTVTLVRNADENPHLLIGMVADITERKLAEAARQESEERYRTVVTMMAEGVLLQAGDGTLLASNPSAEKIFGLSRDQMVQNQETPDLRWRTIYEDGSPFPKENYPNRMTLRTGQPYSNVVMGVYKPDGDLIWISLNTQPIFTPNKSKLQAIVTSFSEITSRIQTEETLRQTIEELAQQKNILQSILDSIGDGVVVADERGKFLVFNPAAKRLMGIGAIDTDTEAWSEQYGVFYPDGVTPLPPNELPMVRAIQGESLDLLETFVRNAQIPTGFYANNTARPLKDEDGNIIGGVVAFSDITERKLAENKIKDALKEKELLLRELHHRVKNNMQIISSLLGLQSDYVKDERDAEMFIDSQYRINAMALTHEKLYQSSNLTSINFNDYIQDITTDLFAAYQLDPSKISIEIDVRDVSLEINQAIPCGLIINELISNALKHAFPNGKQGKIRTVLRVSSEREIELIISDNGVGIPKAVDFHNPGSLGLQLVTGLAELQLKGTVEFDRTVGTTVKVAFKSSS